MDILNYIHFVKDNVLFVFRGLSPINFAIVLSIPIIIVGTVAKQTYTHPNDFIEI